VRIPDLYIHTRKVHRQIEVVARETDSNGVASEIYSRTVRNALFSASEWKGQSDCVTVTLEGRGIPSDGVEVPEYVFDLLEAWLTDVPLDFKGHQVPELVQQAVRDRLATVQSEPNGANRDDR